MKKVDMHMHTCASDGTWDAEELKRELIKNKIEIFSVTDHDCIDNIINMKTSISPKDNLIFIPGTELTTEYEGREYHLTLYNFDLKNQQLLAMITETNNNKINANKEYIKDYASKKFENVSVEDYDKYVYDRKRGGWKSLNYMVDKGIHSDILVHLGDFALSGMKAKLKKPEEVILTAKKSGGKIFLAHPSYHYRKTRMPMEELEYWLSLGIDGIECFSPYNKGEEQYYIDFCKKNNLMISGGSDCHGMFIPARKLGLPDVKLDDLNIKQLLQ